MPLDPSIALSVKPFNVDLGTIYNNLAAQRQAEQTQQLNALKLQEAQQAQVTSNALRQLNPNAPDYITQVTQISPALGMQLHKERAAAEASGAQTAERRAAAAKTQSDIIAQEFRNISADPSDANVGSVVGRLKASSLFSPQQIAGIEANVQMLLQKPLPERSKFLSQFGATAGELKPPTPVKPQLQQLQEYRATLPKGSAERKAADDAINKLTTHAPAAVTTVQLPPQEKAEQGARGAMLVKQYESIADAARLATKSMPAIEANLATLDKGFDTGFGTEAKAAGAKVLGALGVQKAEQYATDAQTFVANASSAVLQKQLEQKGPQTEADSQRISQTGAQLGNTKAANQFLLDVAKAQLKRDIDQRNFYDKWRKEHKTYDGAEDAWASGPGGKSLFDRPELAKYKARSGEVPAASTKAATRTIVRTGTSQGRKVNQYSDGTIEYAD